MAVDLEELNELMAAMAAERTAVFDFVDHYGETLAHVVRRHLRDLGRGDLTGDADEVTGLVIDVALLLADSASSWRPGGALPWNWAQRAVRSRVAAVIGHARASIDPDDLFDHTAPSPVVDLDIDLDALCGDDVRMGLLRDALAEVAVAPLHRRVHLEYRIQHSLGDPSPSHTVARVFGLSEANIRQIDRRVRVRLGEVVYGDARYRPLRVIPWIDGPDPTELALA